MSDAAPEVQGDAPIVAFFDVDNTLIRGASAFHLAKAARRMGILRPAEIFRFAWHQATFLFVGENNRHLGSIKDRALVLIKGYTVAELEELANEVFDHDIKRRLWPETVELTQEHIAKGHQVWLVSATPQIVGSVIAKRLGLTGALGTRFREEDGVFTGEFEGSVVHGEDKAVHATALAAELGATLADCWAYSDSRNDIPLLSLVGHPTVVNPDGRLEKHAKDRGWPIIQLKRSSIKDAQRTVRREAKRTTGGRVPKAAKPPKPGVSQRAAKKRPT